MSDWLTHESLHVRLMRTLFMDCPPETHGTRYYRRLTEGVLTGSEDISNTRLLTHLIGTCHGEISKGETSEPLLRVLTDLEHLYEEYVGHPVQVEDLPQGTPTMRGATRQAVH